MGNVKAALIHFFPGISTPLTNTTIGHRSVAAGMRVTSRPPHRSVRAAFPHTAPTSGVNGNDMPYAVPQPRQKTVRRTVESNSISANEHDHKDRAGLSKK
jgi:hypothetical protein